MKILCIGHITYDITFPCDTYPEENTKTRFHEKQQCAGGPATIAAFLLAKWKMEVELAGQVGSDEYGRKIKKELTLNNVGVNNLILNNDIQTSHSLVLANRSNGKRTIFIYNDKNASLKPFKPLKDPDIILIDGHEYEASKQILKSYPNAISIIDAGRDKKEIVDLAGMVNYLVCSLEFAEKVTGIKIDFNNHETLANIFITMEKKFKNNIVITLKSHGCVYKDKNQIKIMPSIKVKTIDSTAAGDIFHGAFVYGIANKFDYEKTIKYASIAAALSVTRVGGYRSIPSLEEMNEVYEQIK